MSDTLRTDALLASHREKNKDGCCDVRRAMRQVEEIIAHARQLETELSAALQRAEKAEAEIKRAFSALSFCGVPEERARSVANGIQVFMTRIDREHATLKAELSRYREAEKALPEEPSCPSPEHIQHIRFEGCDCVVMSPEEYEALHEYVTKLRAHAAALQAERDAMREDAERYRWLRNQYEDRPYAVFAWDDDCAIGNAELDAAIDAARGKK